MRGVVRWSSFVVLTSLLLFLGGASSSGLGSAPAQRDGRCPDHSIEQGTSPLGQLRGAARSEEKGGARGMAGRGARAPSKMTGRMVTLSKTMSWLLRHGAGQAGVRVGEDGSVRVDEMLALPKFKGYSREEVAEVVANNEKQRFAVSGAGADWSVRAHQGHSQKVASLITGDQGLTRLLTPPADPVLHGTFREAWDKIKGEGLKRMARQHIHLTDLHKPSEQGQVSGFRASCQVIVTIDVAQAMADGVVFLRSGNGVILTEGVAGCLPAKYISGATDREGRSLLEKEEEKEGGKEEEGEEGASKRQKQ
mmetsp:Transcript_37231/g.84750  ORF Transcript_37231/g.84750 Transcript_37231/m.84750 type:complete len:308 (-) Transcript_37231:163-1086(-)